MAEESKASVIGALVANLAIAVTKFAASLYTGSTAMLTEAIHSLVDTGNQGLLLLGMRRSKRAPTESHPMGYGMELYFWTFVVALTIFALGGAFSIYEGYHKIVEPEPMTSAWVNLAVLAAAMAFEGASLVFAVRQFRSANAEGSLWQAIRQSKDPTGFAVIFEDTAAVLGLLIAFAGVCLAAFAGFELADGISSVCIGLLLIGAAGLLASETLSLLTGESASREVLSTVRKILNDDPRIVEVVEILSLHMGPSQVLIAATVDLADDSRGQEIETAIRTLTKTITDARPEISRVFLRPGEAAPERAGAA